ncbi:MAG: TSUP family transporter [Flavobacteriales bacterium]
MDISTALVLLAIGAVAGFASGLVGIGGGLIIVPALVFFLGMPQQTAQGTSLALMLPPVGAAAVLAYHRAGHVNFTYAALIMVTFIAGAWAGGKSAVRLQPATVRLVFSAFLLYVAVAMAWRSIGEIWGGKGG